MENIEEKDKKTILIVDDEKPIVEILVYNLQKEGYNTLEANDGLTAVEIATTKKPDLILLDIMLPKMDGLTVCKKIRASLNVPILMLTAKDEEIDKILGLELGADDYITKPFSVRELMARIKANLRKSEIKESPAEANEDKTKKIVVGSLTLDLDKFEAKVDGEVIDLTLREFEVLKKSKSSIVPAFFSDMRSVANLENFPMRQTYVDVDEVTLESLKYALKDKSKVYLSANKNSLFELLPDGFQASTGLNVILGNRSSGKSVTLNKIENYNSNVKYIKQFALIEKDENNEEQIFSKKVKQKKSGVIEDYLKEFKEVLTDILSIDVKKYENDLVDYLQTWIEYAIDYDKRDSFAKAVLYTSGEIDYLDESDAIKVIDALIVLLSNNKYHNLIDKYLERDKIIELLKELLICYDNIRLKNTIAKETNLIVGMIKNKLTLQSNISAPKSFNFKEYYISRKKIKVFNELFNEIKKPRIVMNEKINKFTVVAETRGFSSATELKNSYGKKISFKAAMDQYDEGYKYILELKNIESIPETDFYRLIVYFDYKILNEYKLKVSGGERSEFRLLEELNDVSYYDMLLIDEPESSFDNMFLNQEVNERIKEISQKIPVFLVTHNNSIGESIKPDYYMYTKRCLKPDGKIEFKLYGGYPTAKELSTVDGDRIDNYSSLINSLEGGESVYNERCNDYEILKNR